MGLKRVSIYTNNEQCDFLPNKYKEKKRFYLKWEHFVVHIANFYNSGATLKYFFRGTKNTLYLPNRNKQLRRCKANRITNEKTSATAALSQCFTNQFHFRENMKEIDWILFRNIKKKSLSERKSILILDKWAGHVDLEHKRNWLKHRSHNYTWATMKYLHPLDVEIFFD